MLKIEDIRNVIPHRYPFLLVDRILDFEPGRRAVGLKNVTINESFFEGHFPGHAVMPGVLLVEAMAQVGGVILLSVPENRGKLAYFAGLDKVRFKKPVVPGDCLISEVEMIWTRGNFGKVKATARVDGEVVVEGVLLYSVVERDRGGSGLWALGSGPDVDTGEPPGQELAASRGGER
jgi:3-hydroxyacyl-[acyl-carrier-protein] dehydratase